MCGEGRLASGLGVIMGAAALAALVTAFVSNVWLYTKEPVDLPNNQPPTTVTFRIGFWRVCPALSKLNYTTRLPSPSCALIKYSNWDELKHTEIGVTWTDKPVEFTPTIISKIRLTMPFAATSVLLLLLGTLAALVGHCNTDHKTLIACALYTIAGLSLASGLVMFASVVSEVYAEGNPARHRFHYKYGWSFISAGASLVLSELAGALCMTAYLGQAGGTERSAVISSGSSTKQQPHLQQPHHQQQQQQQPDVAVGAGPTACHSCRKEAERACTLPRRLVSSGSDLYGAVGGPGRYATLAHHPPPPLS